MLEVWFWKLFFFLTLLLVWAVLQSKLWNPEFPVQPKWDGLGDIGLLCHSMQEFVFPVYEHHTESTALNNQISLESLNILKVYLQKKNKKFIVEKSQAITNRENFLFNNCFPTIWMDILIIIIIVWIYSFIKNTCI